MRFAELPSSQPDHWKTIQGPYKSTQGEEKFVDGIEPKEKKLEQVEPEE